MEIGDRKGCAVLVVVLVLVFGFFALTQPGQVIFLSILNNTIYAKPDPINISVTNPVYEPQKTGDVLLFPKDTQDWKVIAYAIAPHGGHSADTLVIEYWCQFKGDKPEKWTRCYPAPGTEAD